MFDWNLIAKILLIKFLIVAAIFVGLGVLIGRAIG